MKRTTIFLMMFLTALCCALTVSAADYAVHSVTISGNAVEVSVTAKANCALWGAVYEESGKLTAAKSENVSGATDAQTVTLTFDNIPANAYAKAFLLDKETLSPLSASGDTRIAYAILYADGTMVFQHGDTPEDEREVISTYPVDMTGRYAIQEGYELAPWHDGEEEEGHETAVKKVIFADKIQPKSTAYWFYECANLTEIVNIENLDTSRVTDMSDMFALCGSLKTLDVHSFDTSNVTNMSGMFASCEKLTVLDVSGFNTANVTDMHFTFSDCWALTTLDVSKFNTANVTNMRGMFAHCWALKALDVSKFDTSNVTDMSRMFADCEALTVLDLKNFITDNVTSMYYMFHNSFSLTALDISGFKTKNVADVRKMFWNCSKLITIYASREFVTSQVLGSDDMFSDCSSLIGGKGTRYDKNHTDKEYAHIDGGAENPGYFTAKT